MGESRTAAVPDVVGGRYRLVKVIGSGGMGRVWLADDELLDRRVAIKEITTPADGSTSQVLDLQLRTMREARAAARLDHPAVITVFDVIWRPGQSWIVMEYVPSRSLHDVVRKTGPLSHTEAARIGLSLLGALRAAHAVGVLHRDVKPHNVLLADDGRVVLTDFGLATFEGADGSDPLMGSPSFVAPERLRPGDSGPAADLWSLGATLYDAVEGRPPFLRESTRESLNALLTEPPDPARRTGPLTPVIAALLQKDPARRPTAARVEDDLRRVATGAGPRARGLARVHPPTTLALSTPRNHPHALSTATNHPSRAAVLGVAATAVLLSVGIVVTSTVAGAEPRRAAPVMVAAPPFEPCAFNTAGATDTAGTAGAADTAGGADTAGTAGAIDTPDTPGTAGAADTGATPVNGDDAVPDGWIRHRDEAGVALPLPAGWTRSASGSTTCFRDPASARAFTVDTEAPATGESLTFWQAAERTERALPGYTRVSMGVLLLKRGGADWEYSWQPVSGPRQQTRRVLIKTDSGRAYLLRWTTPASEWTVNIPIQQRIISGFQSTS